MRKSTIFFTFIALNLMVMAALYVQSRIALSERHTLRKDMEEIVRTLSLTDMVFSTDARYTRHPTQADLFSAFQDYPGSIEHFPTGSIIAPPDFTSTGTFIKVSRRKEAYTDTENK
ncbi:MAG: hypothetical protein AB1488_05320 [Nitrospirota bacterium]